MEGGARVHKMADVAVNLLLTKIQPLTDEKAGLPEGIRSKLKDIVRCLRLLKNQLRLVEIKASTDNRARTWVEQVKKTIAHIRKVIDEYQLEIGSSPRNDGLLSLPRRLLHFLRSQILAQPHVAAQLEDVTTQLNEIFDSMHEMLPESTDTAAAMRLRTTTASSSEPGPQGQPPSLKACKAVGLEAPTKKLVLWLIEGEERLSVISVLGMGGLGKTTLALLAFNHTMVKAHFECFAWITVTRSFNMESLFQSMIMQFYQSTDEEAPSGLEDKSLDDLTLVLAGFLQEKRYVIVLDDVWGIDVCEFIKFRLPNSNTSSRILMTTRLVEVAHTCATTYSFVYNHQPLNFVHAYALFCTKVQATPAFFPKVETLAQKMVKRCSGLPLAIVILAGLLFTKQETESEWLQVSQKLGSLFDSDVITNMMFTGYDDLPDNVKPCFLYFGLFPENFSMDRTRLIRLWLAEGFIKKEQQDATEEDAEGYLNELIQRNLVHASEVDIDGRVKSYRVHDIYHAMIVSKLMETNFGAKSSGFSLHINQKSPRLSIQGDVEYPPQDTKSKHLLSLLIFNMRSWPKSCMHTILIQSRMLKVLDLSNAPLVRFPNEIPTMPDLRYLSLRNTKLNKLPNLIGKLKQLITLDLKGTSILELPSEILKLKHLQNLLVHPRSRQRQGTKISFGITHLRTLQKLSLIDVSTRIRTIKEIKNLTQLRRLGITNLPKGDGKDLCSSLEEMKHLQSLSITPRDDELIELETLTCPPPLQRLYFHGSLEKLPTWIKRLTNLAKIKLRLTKLTENSLVPLQDLPNLKMLKLEEQASDLEELSLKKGGFKELRTIHLYHFERLKTMKIEKGALPSLQKLYMQNCKKLEDLPLGIDDLCEFKELHLIDMPESFLNKFLIDDGENRRPMPIMRSYISHEESASMVFVFSSSNSSSSSSLNK